MVAYEDIYVEYGDKESFLSLTMEYFPEGNLSQFIKKYQQQNKQIPEEIIKSFIKQIAAALAFMHDKNVVHKNLKVMKKTPH